MVEIIGTKRVPPKKESALGKLNPVKPVVECRYPKAYDNTAKHAHLQGLDPAYRW